MENRLKERLTGAAILVALIVMLVPEMFHGQRGDVAASASSSGDGPPVRSYTIDLSSNPKTSAPLQSTPPAVAPQSEQPSAPPTPEPTPAPVPTPTLVPPPAPAAAAALPTPRAEPAVVAGSHPPGTAEHNAASGAWAVQLGLFAKRDNAERLQHAAQAKGFPVTLSGADARGLYRVYAGGLVDRAAAEAYAQRLKDQGMPAAVTAAP
jgi:DedD protein